MLTVGQVQKLIKTQEVAERETMLQQTVGMNYIPEEQKHLLVERRGSSIASLSASTVPPSPSGLASQVAAMKAIKEEPGSRTASSLLPTLAQKSTTVQGGSKRESPGDEQLPIPKVSKDTVVKAGDTSGARSVAAKAAAPVVAQVKHEIQLPQVNSTRTASAAAAAAAAAAGEELDMTYIALGGAQRARLAGVSA